MYLTNSKEDKSQFIVSRVGNYFVKEEQPRVHVATDDNHAYIQFHDYRHPAEVVKMFI